nr:hypothetical protein Iba_chr11aCG13390 [Ipomoea batatas]
MPVWVIDRELPSLRYTWSCLPYSEKVGSDIGLAVACSHQQGLALLFRMLKLMFMIRKNVVKITIGKLDSVNRMGKWVGAFKWLTTGMGVVVVIEGAIR